MHSPTPLRITIRPAVREDEPAIRALVRSEHLNPLGVDWRNFLMAEDSTGRLVAIGAVKTHGDGSRELASIATVPDARGRGAAGAVIREILARRDPAAGGGRLYLTCRRSMKGFYEKFGFREIGIGEMPPYFRRLYGLFSFMSRMAGKENRLTVMMRSADELRGSEAFPEGANGTANH
jgi:N-acetylglutamate synthase-like GNAT family acetyltransferase